MANAIIARVPTGTNTIDRQWKDTETRKQVVGENVPDLLQAVARIVRRFRDVAIESASGVQAIFIVPPREQADSISEASTLRLLDGGHRAISAIASDVLPTGSMVAEIVAELSWPDAPIARERGTSPALTQVDQRYAHFRNRLITTLIDEPIEDGVTHRAEQVINEALRTNSSECRAWLSRTLAEHCQRRPSISASIIRCIGRVDYDQVEQWGLDVVDGALRNEDVEVREAAIRALEAWGGPEALDILHHHTDTEDWLKDYVEQVIVDLAGTTK